MKREGSRPLIIACKQSVSYPGKIERGSSRKTGHLTADDREAWRIRGLFIQLGVAASLLALTTGAASAISALEFLRAEADNNEARMTKEEVIKLVAKGYKNVPDWARLSSLMKKKILEKGYTTQDIDAVAEEAALDGGMTK
jgi:hypothetical protein